MLNYKKSLELSFEPSGTYRFVCIGRSFTIIINYEEFLVQVGVHQGSALSPLLFAIAVDVISENAREGLMNEILCADDLVLMSESVENLKEKFLK